MQLAIEYQAIRKEGLSTQIANAIRKAIVDGHLAVEEKLPSETELADRFGVSRATVREALKRLAAQNLIRSERGAAGGAFVNRITWDEAQDDLVSTCRLLIGMNDIPLEDAIEARFTMEASCLPLAAQRRTADDLAALRAEVYKQRDKDLSDEDFCASDVRFHSVVARASGNPLLGFQVSGAVEAMQPLMNMLVYRLRDRESIADLHKAMTDALEARDAVTAQHKLDQLAAYTRKLADLRRVPRDDG
ncbi:FadR/GntR family transcriptional regulator [Roseibium aggregatum]|uniref:FadR/GntR family transcriptional regulator n=1 Tax=Roseibium aggregatum TaxID=187304 RepID=UPI003AF3EE8A